VGAVIAFVAFLIANAKPLPLPDIAPQLTAGAAKLPMVKWQDADAKAVETPTEIVAVDDPVREVIEPVVEPVEEAPEEDYSDVLHDYNALDLL
jgi:hypothetical protein